MPILSIIKNKLETKNLLLEHISKELNVKIEEILDFDLALYPKEKGCLVGLNEEMMSCTKLDNLLSVYTGLIGLVESENESEKINVFVGFDNEEIGSSTKQGADSNYLSNILERIMYALGYDREVFLQILSSSFMLSADSGHIAHPAFLEKSDITNQCLINEGVALKLSVNQKYTSDGYSMAVIKEIAQDKAVSYTHLTLPTTERV